MRSKVLWVFCWCIIAILQNNASLRSVRAWNTASEIFAVRHILVFRTLPNRLTCIILLNCYNWKMQIFRWEPDKAESAACYSLQESSRTQPHDIWGELQVHKESSHWRGALIWHSLSLGDSLFTKFRECEFFAAALKIIYGASWTTHRLFRESTAAHQIQDSTVKSGKYSKSCSN